MKRVFLICWGYAFELLLATGAYFLLLRAFGEDKLTSFLSKTWIAWSTVCGLVLAAAVAMLVLIIQMLTSEFGGYLVSRSADGPFKKAYGFAIAFSFLGTIGFVIAGNVDSRPATHVAGVLLLLVAINLYTMVTNAFNLQRIHALFERIKRREEQHDQQT